ncbi:Adenylate kinase [hydrothermal vent metagenome]|uniref:Adenylate kinase n=1 Tax=hydrothermal vent metagenome TaxID=652676 RepID=A0A3B0TGN3_9ZZZZ
MRLVLLGPPGAGKGSLAFLLKEAMGVEHISTGDILREEMKNDTLLGKEAKGYIESGQLVPDEVVTKLIANCFESGRISGGYLLDGFPRTKAQALDLNEILEKVEKPLDFAIYLNSTLEVVLKRLTGRRICKGCGAIFHMENKPPKQEGICDSCQGDLYQRADDNEETIRKRMDVYLENTTPIVDFYQGLGNLKKVNGDEDTAVVYKGLMEFLNENGQRN